MAIVARVPSLHFTTIARRYLEWERAYIVVLGIKLKKKEVTKAYVVNVGIHYVVAGVT